MRGVEFPTAEMHGAGLAGATRSMVVAGLRHGTWFHARIHWSGKPSRRECPGSVNRF